MGNTNTFDDRKVEAFEELVDEIIANGEKVIVFSQYTSMLKVLENKLNSKDEEIRAWLIDERMNLTRSFL